MKTAPAPRLFCDICDMFDLHDTDDCPKQASSEFDSPPMLLNTSSVAYNQHSHYGGARGVQRPFCDNCESELSKFNSICLKNFIFVCVLIVVLI